MLYGALFADGVENGNTSLWSQTVVAAPTSTNLRVTTAAKLGPTQQHGSGCRSNLFSPHPASPGAATYVRVGPEAGFHDERTLAGTFFVDPQSLTMSPDAGSERLLAARPSPTASVPAASTRLTFDLNRNDSVGGWALSPPTSTTAPASRASPAAPASRCSTTRTTATTASTSSGRAASLGHLTVWKTRYVNGAPDGTAGSSLFSVDLPGMQTPSINHVFAGMVAGQDSGTFGALYLDELSFRR